MAVRYRVGEFAELAGVSAKTLRFYDEIGLLRPASIDPRTRYRHYLPQQLQALTSILALKDVGVPLADIRRLTQTAASKNDRRETLMDLQKTVEGSLDKARESLRWINAALAELNDCTHPVPVAVKRRPPLLVASVRSNVRSYEEIEPFKEALLGELPPESIAGLPAVTLACAYSADDDASAESAYDAVRKWMNIRGYQLAGPKREIDFGQLLEIQFPLESIQA